MDGAERIIRRRPVAAPRLYAIALLFARVAQRWSTPEGTRRHPPPWFVQEIAGAFAILDGQGREVARVRWDRYADLTPASLTKEEARDAAARLARLPGLLKG